MKRELLKHEVALIKAKQACDMLEEALTEAPKSRRIVLNCLRNMLRKHSAELVTKGSDA